MKWKLVQENKWPFNINIMFGDNVIVSQGRYAYSSKDRDLEDVMSARHFPYGLERDNAALGNKMQLNALLLASAAPDLLEALEAWEKAIPRLDEFASVSPDSLRGKALAAIAKATGR